jgi:hypothetical protein
MSNSTQATQRKKTSMPLVDLANYHQANIDRLEAIKREADQNEDDAAGNPTYNDEWDESMQQKLNGHYENLGKLNGILEA